MKNEKQKEFEKLIVDEVHKSESLDEWKEKVSFALGFNF